MEVSASLRAAIAESTGRGDCVLEDVRREPLDYDAFLANRSVNRVRGIAVADGQRLDWSLIEKVTEGPLTASPYLVDNARRELAFYSSQLPDELPAAVRSPRVLGSPTDPDGRITLWLEEIQHDGSRPLDAGTILAIARDLGELAGHWIGRTLEDPWLFCGWIDRHGQPQAVVEGLAALWRANPALVPRWGHRLGEAQRLVLAQPRLLKILEMMPQTLCHHDAVGANVFRSAQRTVLIDWESVGPGPAGADLASLLFSSARRGDTSAMLVAANLDAAFDAYIEGLRAGTDSIDIALVRKGLDASIALRWKLAADVAAALERGEAPRRGSAPNEVPEQALEELSVLVEVLLDAARRVLDES